jgi:hypothetical protein
MLTETVSRMFYLQLSLTLCAVPFLSWASHKNVYSLSDRLHLSGKTESFLPSSCLCLLTSRNVCVCVYEPFTCDYCLARSKKFNFFFTIHKLFSQFFFIKSCRKGNFTQ